MGQFLWLYIQWFSKSYTVPTPIKRISEFVVRSRDFQIYNGCQMPRQWEEVCVPQNVPRFKHFSTVKSLVNFICKLNLYLNKGVSATQFNSKISDFLEILRLFTNSWDSSLISISSECQKARRQHQKKLPKAYSIWPPECGWPPECRFLKNLLL